MYMVLWQLHEEVFLLMKQQFVSFLSVYSLTKGHV